MLDLHGIIVSNQYVCKVLRHDVGAKFKRVRKVPYLGNSLRSLILRQSYAKFMLEQLRSGVRVINVDQTWLNATNFVRRQWKRRGQVNSVVERKVNPRISVIMAICTQGRLYCALT